MANSADPEQLASSSQLIWIYTVCKGRAYTGSAGPGLMTLLMFWNNAIDKIVTHYKEDSLHLLNTYGR